MVKKDKKEYLKRYYQEHKKELLEKAKDYRIENADKILEWKLKNKEKIKEYNKQYKAEHKDEIKSYQKEYIEKNKEQITKRNSEYHKVYYKLKENRARAIIKTYIKKDKEYNRGECTLTPEQLVKLWENGCYWCGEKDYMKLGADRIDNTKAHTLENCVCACKSCNDKRNTKTFEEYKKIIQQSLL
jgi:hypothetical protein